MSSSQTQTLIFLVTAFPPEVSGSALFNWARAQWFAQQGNYRVVVFAPDWQKAGDPPGQEDNNVIIERYPSKPWIPYKLTHVPTFAAAGLINQKIAAYQPSLIAMTDVERYFLLSTWRLPGRGYAQKNQIPYIAEYHTDVYNFSATYPGWQWLRAVVRRTRLMRYLYHQLDVTLCPSHAASKSCQEMGVDNPQVVPFFGTDISMYDPNRRDRKWLAPWLSADEKDNKVIIFLGRLGFEKRVDLLIKAFGQLRQNHPHCSLLIVGDGPADVVKSLKQLAAPIPNIHFTGFLLGETKANVLASSDIFCSPSPYETFGLTGVEAMASGVPVVMVDSGGVSDYIVNGVNGYLAPPDNTAALVTHLEKALLSDNTALVQRALQDAKGYSVEQGCQNLHHYYQHLLKVHASEQLVGMS